MGWILKYRNLTYAIQALRGANKRRQFLVQLLDLQKINEDLPIVQFHKISYLYKLP